MTPEEALAVEVALLDAETRFAEDLVAAGIVPAGARRDPTVPELAAGVRFAELDRIVNDAAALIARKADTVRTHVLDGLAEQLATIAAETNPYKALEELDRLTDPTNPDTIPGLRKTIDDTATAIRGDLEATARAGAAEAIAEARRQGIPDQLLPDALDPVDDTVRAAADAHAARVAKAPAARLLDVAAQAGGRAAMGQGATGVDVMGAALDAAEAATMAGTEDLARQAANVTHGLGRAAAQAALPAPAAVYASELLDSRTCGPCATVDGRTYVDLAAGLVDYPGAGGYRGCDGGARCRGTLVLVHGSEAPPTLLDPGHGPAAPGGPVDPTPRGPSDVVPPHPTPGAAVPDVGTPPATDLTLAAIDDTGRTVVPLDHVEEPIATVPVPALSRDPELARMSEDELDALMADPTTPVERQLAAADEFDRRQTGDVWMEEDHDAATLARWEEEREAWEAAGGYAADNLYPTAAASTAKPAGRRIDRVRAQWTEEVEQQQLAGEAATNGNHVRRDRVAEFTAKYGTNTAVLYEGPARVAYYYASPELRAYWDTLPKGRPTFAEFAVDRGIADAKTLKRARAAAEARDDAIRRADESAAGKAKRAAQRAEARKRRLPLSAGERLAREQARRDRLRAAERKANAEARRLEGGPPDAPTA